VNRLSRTLLDAAFRDGWVVALLEVSPGRTSALRVLIRLVYRDAFHVFALRDRSKTRCMALSEVRSFFSKAVQSLPGGFRQATLRGRDKIGHEDFSLTRT